MVNERGANAEKAGRDSFGNAKRYEPEAVTPDAPRLRVLVAHNA